MKERTRTIFVLEMGTSHPWTENVSAEFFGTGERLLRLWRGEEYMVGMPVIVLNEAQQDELLTLLARHR